jgi:hypothetical protein
MKTTLSLILALSAFASLNAHAGQETIGIGYCQSANTVCATKGDSSAPGAMVVCLFGTDQAHAYVSIEKNGTSERHDFNVTKDPNSSHLVGAGVRYSGQGLALHINTDVPTRPEGILSDISIEDLGIKGKTLFCNFQN